ncbi:hypothetical protein SAMN05518863_11715 [Candidatus Pantoea symbiotica]|uniref:Uncharacterized protein n=1 Tax=Candidatus Pantoea symbiotica TaxID=1884370 RepID=A0A1I4EG13_9GAMM|nr:hypothetical protein SAMN05518863_11715 [Pantoea symbiotica]SFV07972.1 hypothetical protein SAMN05518864_11715 [Pantoea sp. YR525]
MLIMGAPHEKLTFSETGNIRSIYLIEIAALLNFNRGEMHIWPETHFC